MLILQDQVVFFLYQERVKDIVAWESEVVVSKRVKDVMQLGCMGKEILIKATCQMPPIDPSFLVFDYLKFFS